MNSRGVITIPIRLREAFGLKADDELIIESSAEGILLRPSMSMPIELYSKARIAEFAAEDAAIGIVLDHGR
jgi:AbrB family looped-hinge helix DNA binding protein